MMNPLVQETTPVNGKTAALKHSDISRTNQSNCTQQTLFSKLSISVTFFYWSNFPWCLETNSSRIFCRFFFARKLLYCKCMIPCNYIHCEWRMRCAKLPAARCVEELSRTRKQTDSNDSRHCISDQQIFQS